MENERMLTILFVALVLMVWSTRVIEAAPMGTAFTYQGHLYDNNDVANGLYDFQFKLFDDDSDGNQIGSDADKPDVNVVDGYFTVELDFGDVFDGDARWLEIGARPGASTGGFTTLSPRQQITPTPYAMYASDTKVKQLIQDFVVAAGQDVSAGDVVTFLNGYVQKGFLGGSVIHNGSEYVFNSANTSYISAAALSSTKFVVAYSDEGNSDSGTAIIGDVSGNIITYGSEHVFNFDVTNQISVAALSPTKFVVAYRHAGDSGYGTAIIGDVSGNTITYGLGYVFNSANTHLTSVAALTSTKFVVAYLDGGNYYGTAIIGDVSGNTITYGSEYVFNSAGTYQISVAALSSNTFVVAYMDGGNSYYGTAIIGFVISGNTITYGSEYVFNSGYPEYISAAALTSTKFVVAYSDADNSDRGAAVIGDVVSGNIIFYGSEYAFTPAFAYDISVTALNSTKFTVAYRDAFNYHYGTATIGDVSGNTITYGSEYVFNSAGTYDISVTGLTSTKFAVAYTDEGNSDYGTAVIGDIIISGRMTGVAKESKTAGQTVSVIIGGVSDVHSGLTMGELYYSDTSGNLTTGVTDWPVGLAISATELLLDIEIW